MPRHHGIVDRVLGHAKVVIRSTLHARELFVGGHGWQNIAACGDLNAVALQVQVSHFEGAAARPNDENHFAAGLVFELVNQPLPACREVRRGGRQIFFMHQFGTFDRFFKCLHAVAAKGRVLRHGGNGDAGFVQRNGIRNRVL